MNKQTGIKIPIRISWFLRNILGISKWYDIRAICWSTRQLPLQYIFLSLPISRRWHRVYFVIEHCRTSKSLKSNIYFIRQFIFIFFNRFSPLYVFRKMRRMACDLHILACVFSHLFCFRSSLSRFKARKIAWDPTWFQSANIFTLQPRSWKCILLRTVLEWRLP